PSRTIRWPRVGRGSRARSCCASPWRPMGASPRSRSRSRAATRFWTRRRATAWRAGASLRPAAAASRSPRPSRSRSSSSSITERAMDSLDRAIERDAPPVPAPLPEGLPWWRSLIAFRTNVIPTWPASAYEDELRVGNFLGRRWLLVHAPEAIRRVLVDNAANYRRTRATIRILRPLVGRGLFLSEGEDWRHQRRTLAPAFAPRTVPLLAQHV